MTRDLHELDLQAVADARDAFAAGDWGKCFDLLNKVLEEKRRCNNEQWDAWAERHLQRRMSWYRETLVSEMLGRWKAGEFKNREAYDLALEVRASALMNDEKLARWYVAVSPNCDACMTTIHGVPADVNGEISWETVAAEALEADAKDDLWHAHIWGDTKPLQVRNDWCEHCESWQPDREETPLHKGYACAACSVP